MTCKILELDDIGPSLSRQAGKDLYVELQRARAMAQSLGDGMVCALLDAVIEAVKDSHLMGSNASEATDVKEAMELAQQFKNVHRLN